MPNVVAVTALHVSSVVVYADSCLSTHLAGFLRRQLAFKLTAGFPMQYALYTIQTAGDLRRQLDITRTAGFLCRQLVIYVDSCCLMQAAGFFMQKAAYLRRKQVLWSRALYLHNYGFIL